MKKIVYITGKDLIEKTVRVVEVYDPHRNKKLNLFFLKKIVYIPGKDLLEKIVRVVEVYDPHRNSK